MAATGQVAEVWQGNDTVITIEVVDAAGAAEDLTNAQEATFVVTRKRGETALITKTLTGGGIAIDTPAEGKLTVTIAAGDIAALTGICYTEARVTAANGSKVTTTQGWLWIHPAQITG